MRRPEMPMNAHETTETAYAKINVALHVRSRRADGYHALESLFVFACHGDELTGRERSDGLISLTMRGPFAAQLGNGADNLVITAARALQCHIGETRGAAFTLTNNLPVASGIGGGSADAAATLRLLNNLWDVKVGSAELERIALNLGSDVPACISSGMQLVRGRGEVLKPWTVAGLAGRPMLLVNPGVAISTARIFHGWDQVDRGPLDASSLDELVSRGRNDLEQPAIAAAPVISELLTLLGQYEGVRIARMSGSGATCFALFDSERDLSVTAAAIRARRPGWWILETEIRTA